MTYDDTPLKYDNENIYMNIKYFASDDKGNLVYNQYTKEPELSKEGKIKFAGMKQLWRNNYNEGISNPEGISQEEALRLNIYNNLSNNNKENNNKENNNKIEKIKKSRPSIFSQALELYQPNEYFTLDDWQEWIEYKQARCKNLTLQTFKQNFKFLLGLGVNARASINQSINHNWQGLFEVKQNQQQGQNQGYFKGLSAEQQFASVADNSYNPDDYDFSKLPIYS
jgi:hypothetical protein